MVQLLMVTFASFFHNMLTVLVLLSKKFVTLLAYVCRCIPVCSMNACCVCDFGRVGSEFSDAYCCTEMLASEQLKSVDIDDVHQSEYKIIDLESDTKYIVYLRAVTVADGEKTFVEDRTTVLGGLLLPLL